MGNIRSNFNSKTKNSLCESVNGHCSICGKCTTWVNEDKDTGTAKKDSIGEAAHIEAASKGGPRYNPNQSDEERSRFDNGIWVCSNCHTEIDNNEEKYDVKTLRYYKSIAMKKAQEDWNISRQGNGGIQVQDFAFAMMSFFSRLCGYHEDIHDCIVVIKKCVDGLFSEDSEKQFNTNLETLIGLSKKFEKLKKDLWGKLKTLKKELTDGRLYIKDEIYDLEKKYFDIISNYLIQDIDCQNFFICIKDNFAKLEEIYHELFEEYKNQFYLFYNDGI